MSIICYCIHIKCSKTLLRLGGGAFEDPLALKYIYFKTFQAMTAKVSDFF